MKIIEQLKDWYLTKKTGKTREEREFAAWYEVNVVYRASTISNMFVNFKHIIEVDSKKFMDPKEPFAWIPCADARQYFWPARPLGENCVWRFERVHKQTGIGIDGTTTEEWFINDMGDCDKIFVATNNEQDAVMIALKYGG